MSDLQAATDAALAAERAQEAADDAEIARLRDELVSANAIAKAWGQDVERLNAEVERVKEENARLHVAFTQQAADLARLKASIAAATAEGYADGLHDGRMERAIEEEQAAEAARLEAERVAAKPGSS